MTTNPDSRTHISRRGKKPQAEAKTRGSTQRSPYNGFSKRELYQRLDSLGAAEAHAFRRRLSRAVAPKALHAINADIDLAISRLKERRQALPALTFPDALPVSARRKDIADAISQHQVVIIAGETGSGKTTQIPKICLELGRGIAGKIGHTQPRRIAARSVAERIAEELGEEIGQHVGYAIRFDDRVGPDTAIKLMTDGILLAEISRDRYLREYDTIIIDEAHERSLNIDFLLGYLKHILPKRPDLKVIITSATIDPGSFSRHFTDSTGDPAPIIEVSGRTWPVEIRYRPLVTQVRDKNGTVREVDIDPIDGLLDACRELLAAGSGDILAFFPTERDIREAAEAIEGQQFRNVEVLPLFGRLSNAEQHKVFSPHSRRRIVLATNIAETSLTVPGIEYVIDTGTARISRYSTRTKVQRLPIENISQASANQRSGRCGRVADGIAIRLYSEEDFNARPEFTDPEILRTNLASVVLQMASLRLGDIEDFPFVQSPEHKAIRDGVNLLVELGALSNVKNGAGRQQTPKPLRDEDKATQRKGKKAGVKGDGSSIVLTDIGRQISRIPVDPRFARMLVEAHQSGCLHEVSIIVAALSLQDVRERPTEFQAQADQLHARVKDASSDFLSYLKLWEYITERKRELSGNQFRKMCKREYLHYMRVREWQDLVRQLHSVTAELGWEIGTARNTPTPESISQSLLSGLLSNIGVRADDSKEFIGARNTRFLVHPSSALAKKPPQWIMAAEVIETSRMFARNAAAIAPSWVESLAGHLLKHQYSEPHWSFKRGAAMCYQKSTLYGVPVISDRLVPYHKVNPEHAREMFIRHALVQGEWVTTHAFFNRNRERLEDAAKVEDKARTRGIVVDDDVLYAFYDTKLPANITTATFFDRWWKKTSHKDPQLLDFDPAKLVNPDADSVGAADFPEIWQQGTLDFALSYKFSPGAVDDGVSIQIPVPLLMGIREESFDWLVPGMRAELAEALIRTLPKALRRTVVPAPDFATKALANMTPYSGSFTTIFADELRKLGGSGISSSDFEVTKLPNHLRFNFAAINRRGKVIDQDRSLSALKQRQLGSVKNAVSQASQSSEHHAVREWTAENLGTISETVENTVDGQKVAAYPTLVATKDGVALKVMPTKQQADASLITTTLTMLLKDCTVSDKQMLKGLPLQQRVAVDSWPHGGATGLVSDCHVAVVRDLMMDYGGPVRDPDVYRALKEKVAGGVNSGVRQLVVGISAALPAYANIMTELRRLEGDAIDDIQQQLAFMLPKGAVARHGWSHLRHLPRYLQAIEIRLEEMTRNPDRDADREDEIYEVKEYLEKRLERLPSAARKSASVRDIGWMIQELRVSLFAQRLGTAGSISAQRIRKAIDKLR